MSNFGDSAPPPSVRRLFAGDELPADADDPLVIARLLEDGEQADLRWLTAAAGEPVLGRWLEQRGGRQLSRRSRSFWQLVLGKRASAEVAVAEELWNG